MKIFSNTMVGKKNQKKIVLKKIFFFGVEKKNVYSFDAEKVDLSIAGVFGTIRALFLALPNTRQKKLPGHVTPARYTFKPQNPSSFWSFPDLDEFTKSPQCSLYFNFRINFLPGLPNNTSPHLIGVRMQ